MDIRKLMSLRSPMRMGMHSSSAHTIAQNRCRVWCYTRDVCSKDEDGSDCTAICVPLVLLANHTFLALK
jgi:hypothetical protein